MEILVAVHFFVNFVAHLLRRHRLNQPDFAFQMQGALRNHRTAHRHGVHGRDVRSRPFIHFVTVMRAHKGERTLHAVIQRHRHREAIRIL